MTDNSPILTVARNVARPSQDLVDRFAEVGVSQIVAVLGGRGGLHHSIKPVGQVQGLPERFCGPALTAGCEPGDNLAAFAALAYAKKGDVLVVATDYQGCAVIGDMVSGMAKNAGITALVTDGMVRDLEGLVDVGLPVFCKGLSPNSPEHDGPGTVNLPIQIGGLTVAAGDLICGDLDGVVVVPHAQIEDAAAKLSDFLEAELALLSRIRRGLVVPDHTEELLASDKVVFVD